MSGRKKQKELDKDIERILRLAATELKRGRFINATNMSAKIAMKTGFDVRKCLDIIGMEYGCPEAVTGYLKIYKKLFKN